MRPFIHCGYPDTKHEAGGDEGGRGDMFPSPPLTWYLSFKTILVSNVLPNNHGRTWSTLYLRAASIWSSLSAMAWEAGPKVCPTWSTPRKCATKNSQSSLSNSLERCLSTPSSTVCKSLFNIYSITWRFRLWGEGMGRGGVIGGFRCNTKCISSNVYTARPIGASSTWGYNNHGGLSCAEISG